MTLHAPNACVGEMGTQRAARGWAAMSAARPMGFERHASSWQRQAPASHSADLYIVTGVRPPPPSESGFPLSRRGFRLRLPRGLRNINRSANRGYDRNVRICSLACSTDSS
jgi:hypothetical protein